MKKYIFIVVIMFVIATIFIIDNKNDYSIEASQVSENLAVSNSNLTSEVHAIYFSYMELNNYIKDKSVEEAKKNIDTIITNLAVDNFNWIILQVRPFSDAIYESKLFPVSTSISDSELPFDVLTYFIEKAHAQNIQVHAWINPYRISNDENFVISENHPAYQFLGTNSIKVISGKGIYYNPASDDVTALIVAGVEEIINNYDVDGIHFDDYFYPSSDIDLENYLLYQESGGKMTYDEYRLDNIKRMISCVYSAIKSIDSSILFGIAPQGNIDNNYNSEYLDVKYILSNSGYVDYIMPQIYFGFLNEAKPFTTTLDEWSGLIKIDSIVLIPALALYKSGSSDTYAGSGSNEWLDNSDILKRQIVYSRGIDRYTGFSLFRYDYFYNEEKQNSNILNEISGIRDIINK